MKIETALLVVTAIGRPNRKKRRTMDRKSERAALRARQRTEAVAMVEAMVEADAIKAHRDAEAELLAIMLA